MRNPKISLVAFFALVACDLAYEPQTLPSGSRITAADQAEFTLDVKPLTLEQIALANDRKWRRQAIVPNRNAAEGTSLQQEASARAERLPPVNSSPMYRLGVGDELSLQVKQQVVDRDGVPRATSQVLQLPVKEDGTIFSALLGSIEVRGRTFNVVRDLISQELARRSGLDAQMATELTPPPTGTPPIYRIGAGDVLAITRVLPEVTDEGSVNDVPNTRALVVASNGNVRLLGAGDVDVGGLTTGEAIEEISAELLRNGLNPNIELSIQANNSKPLRLIGDLPTAVEERLIPISEAPVRLVDVVSRLGLQTPPGRDYLIEIRREGERYGVLLNDFLGSESRAPIYLHPNDTIRIQVQESAPDFALNIVGFNSQSVAVSSVSGDGASVELPVTSEPLELVDAVNAAGISVDSEKDVLARIIRNGQEYRVSVRQALIDQPSRKIFLQSGDRIVFEPIVFEKQNVMITGAGTSPQLIEIEQISRPTLSDAVFRSSALADAESDLKQVFLLRQDENEANKFDAYYLDLSNPTRLALANELQLRPDDIIFISDQPASQFTRVVGRITTALRSGLGLASSTEAVQTLVQ
jgi:polysaccharide export outer membrane protein